MKTRLIAIAALISATCCNGAQGSNELPLSVEQELRRLKEQIKEQGERIDRLYRALGPYLERMEEEAARAKKEADEEKALALKEVRKVVDDSLTSLGCVNPAAAEFAVITSEGGLRIFNAEAKAVRTLRQPGQHLSCVAFSPSGGELLSGTESGALLIWDVEKGSRTTVRTNLGRKVDRVTWLGNDRLVWGSFVTYWTDDGKPLDHDKPAGAVLARRSGNVLWQFRGFVRNDFFTITGALDGQRLVVLEIPGQPRGAFLLDGGTGEVLLTCYDSAHGCGPLSVAISPDGNTLAVGYAPYDIILWNARTGERQKLLKGHHNWVVSLAFSADSKRLISGAGDSTARVWDVESGKEIGRIRFPGQSTYVESVGLSPNGDIAFALAQHLLVVGRVR